MRREVFEFCVVTLLIVVGVTAVVSLVVLEVILGHHILTFFMVSKKAWALTALLFMLLGGLGFKLWVS